MQPQEDHPGCPGLGFVVFTHTAFALRLRLRFHFVTGGPEIGHHHPLWPSSFCDIIIERKAGNCKEGAIVDTEDESEDSL